MMNLFLVEMKKKMNFDHFDSYTCVHKLNHSSLIDRTHKQKPKLITSAKSIRIKLIFVVAPKSEKWEKVKKKNENGQRQTETSLI